MATQNSWNNTINSATTVTLNGVTVNVGSDASDSTINLATGAAVKTVTLGSTNSTSKLDLKYGTADFTLASATGTVIKAEATGEVTKPLQPCFRAYLSSTALNVTGDGTAYTVIYDEEDYDIGSNYDTSTGQFTCPVAGVYLFTCAVFTKDLDADHASCLVEFNNTTGQIFRAVKLYPHPVAVSGEIQLLGTLHRRLTAGYKVTVRLIVSGGTKVVDVHGDTSHSYFTGHLIG